ncbi:unnamed protein product [Moneuplotes crassus]|uniref:Uncharacterized protein n=1 Tax=Euplotes crassus TaxID=5936 RepID=A0AAD1UHM5_EUPCR|nr:unnamed protein product [Moneuplotes crassus]
MDHSYYSNPNGIDQSPQIADFSSYIMLKMNKMNRKANSHRSKQARKPGLSFLNYNNKFKMKAAKFSEKYKPGKICKGIPNELRLGYSLINKRRSSMNINYQNFSIKRPKKAIKATLKLDEVSNFQPGMTLRGERFGQSGMRFFSNKLKISPSEVGHTSFEKYFIQSNNKNVHEGPRPPSILSQSCSRPFSSDRDLPIISIANSSGTNLKPSPQKPEAKQKIRNSLTMQMFGQKGAKKSLKQSIMAALLIKLFRYKRQQSIDRALFSQKVEQWKNVMLKDPSKRKPKSTRASITY